MSKFFVTLTAATLLASTAAYAETASTDVSHPRHHKKPITQTQPAADEITAVQDVPPHVVQWFGKAVDDILTDTDKVIDPDAKR